MARPRRVEAEVATSERLLTAAEEEFGAKGFDAARLADIATKAGISRPSLLYHFESKEALYGAVVRTAFQRLAEALAGALTAPGAFEARVDRIVEHFLTFLDEHPAMAALLLRDLLDGRGEGREILLQATLPILDRVENAAIEEGHQLVAGGIPIRAALMQVVSGALVRAVSGAMLEPLWGNRGDVSRAVARVLFNGRSP